MTVLLKYAPEFTLHILIFEGKQLLIQINYASICSTEKQVKKSSVLCIRDKSHKLIHLKQTENLEKECSDYFQLTGKSNSLQ